MDYESEVRKHRFELLDPLAGIYLSATQRQHAQDAMRNADLVVGIVLRLVEDAQAVAASIEGACKYLVARLVRRLGRLRDGADLEREAFLAQAIDVADLERRIRAFEQRSQSLAGWPHSPA